MTIGAIASAIAGAYYLYGSREGQARRKEITSWALKMKAEALEAIEKFKDVSEPAYKDMVKKLSEKYKSVDKGELKKVTDELTSTWSKMKKEVMAEIAKKQAIIDKENSKKTVKKKPSTKRKSAAK